MTRNNKPTVKEMDKKIDELTKTMSELVKEIGVIQNTMRVLDSGVFLAIHSLSVENKVYIPELTKEPKETIKNVGKKISEMYQKVEELNKANRENGEKEEQPAKS